MLTRLRFRNFKRFDEVDMPLGEAVVLIGPNNSGKTTALQALALWEIGVRRWNEKRGGKELPKKRSGVTINRRDLVAIPVPDTNLLWRGLHVRNVEPVMKEGGKKSTKTENICVDVIVDGITDGVAWSCGMEFDYANDESCYCRPLRVANGESADRMPVPQAASQVNVAFLPPMSGLTDREFLKQPGELNVLVGQGQTAQVLRNLCFQVLNENPDRWQELCDHITRLFGVELLAPEYIKERSEITMSYREHGTRLDLSSAGRGLQQTLLLLAYLFAKPGSVLLLDEPDAHLELLRQRQTYNLLTNIAEQHSSQIIAASHSEVILNEAADRDVVIAFVGRPHPLGRGQSQVTKALRDIGFEDYYLAEQRGWILYVEDSTDLAILQAFARTLNHEAEQWLDSPFVQYVGTNLPNRAREHFFGLREAKSDLIGVALFDRLDKDLQAGTPLTEMMWARREIENYFCTEEVLLAYVKQSLPNDLFGRKEAEQRAEVMRNSIQKVTQALMTLGKGDPWSVDIKASTEFLEPLFKQYFAELHLPLELRKSDYHVLASLVPRNQLAAEIVEKLDTIVAVAKQAVVVSQE